METSTTTQEVLELKKRHEQTWRGRPESRWIRGLLGELAELARSLLGLHHHPPEWELMQIAAICLNWLEYRADRQDLPSAE